MRVFIIILLLAAIVIFFPYPKYLYTAEPTEQVLDSTDPSLLVFWGERKHADFYNVGHIYQLKTKDKQLRVKLFSITYASSRPKDIKLGFYYIDGDNPSSVLQVAKYRVIQ